MRRTVSSRLDLTVTEPADLVFWDAADGSESDSFLDSIEQDLRSGGWTEV